MSEEQEEKEAKKGSLSPALHWIVASWKVAVALAAGTTTILVLVFLVFPGSKPAQPCRGTLSGKLSKITVDERVRYRAYLDLQGASAGSASRKQLDAVGRVIHFSVATQGFQGKQLPIFSRILFSTGEPITEPQLRHRHLAFEVAPEECEDSGRRETWVRLPQHTGTYLVEVQLDDDSGNQLDEIRTEPFSVRRRT